MSPNCKNSCMLLTPFTDICRLHKEVEAFTKWISPSPVEDEIRSLLVQQIKSAITSRYLDADVYPFGSYATKLYLPTG